MNNFPSGIKSRTDVVRLLGAIDGRNGVELAEWDIDDFISIPNHDPVIDRCRLRVSDELIPMLSCRDELSREGIAPLVSELIAELESNAQNH